MATNEVECVSADELLSCLGSRLNNRRPSDDLALRLRAEDGELACGFLYFICCEHDNQISGLGAFRLHQCQNGGLQVGSASFHKFEGLPAVGKSGADRDQSRAND